MCTTVSAFVMWMWLPSTVCLVAHNFPLLKAEMEKVGTKLESQILCVDSYLGIREIF
jgi:hypothetical protein